MDSPKLLSFEYARRFGIEVEINDFENRDFKKKPLQKTEVPKGADHVGAVIMQATRRPVEVKKWHNTHNNDIWIVKPDSSCGLEICSPVSKGWLGLKEHCKVIDALANDPKIFADHRCSLHVHVEAADCDLSNLVSIVSWWIKCEGVFLDSVPDHRKINKYCQCLGMSLDVDRFADCQINAANLINAVGEQKYFTLNAYHLIKDKRQTIEFRIIENEGCKDAYLVKNWVRLLVHFVEQAKKLGPPEKLIPGDAMTGILWLDPRQVMKVLGFTPEYQLSKGMEQTRNWLLARLHKNLNSQLISGVFSQDARKKSAAQVKEIIKELGLDESDMLPYLKTKSEDTLFNRGL